MVPLCRVYKFNIAYIVSVLPADNELSWHFGQVFQLLSVVSLEFAGSKPDPANGTTAAEVFAVPAEAELWK